MNRITPAQIQDISNCASQIAHVIDLARQGKYLDSQQNEITVWWLERCVRHVLSSCLRNVNPTVVKCILVSLNQLHISPTTIDTLLTQGSTSTVELRVALSNLEENRAKMTDQFQFVTGLGILIPSEVSDIQIRMREVFVSITSQSSHRTAPESAVSPELVMARQHAQATEAQVRHYQQELAALKAKIESEEKRTGSSSLKSISSEKGGKSAAPPSDEENEKLRSEIERTQKFLQEKVQELEQLKKRYAAEFQKEKEAFLAGIQEKNGKLKETEAELANLRRVLNEREEAYQLLISQKNENGTQLKAALEREEVLKRQVEEQRKTNEDLQAEMGTLRSQINTLTRERDEQARKYEGAQRELERLKEEHARQLKELTDALAKATEDVPLLRQQLATVEGELERNKRELQNAASDRDRYQRDNERLNKENELANDQIRGLHKEIEDLQDKLEKAKANDDKYRGWEQHSTENALLQKELQEKKDALRTLQNELEEAKKNAEGYHSSFLYYKGEHEKLQKSERDLKEHVANLEKQLREANDKLATLNTKQMQLDEQNRKIKEQEQEISKLCEELSERGKLIAEQQASLAATTKQAEIANASKGEADKELEGLRAQREEFEKANKELTQLREDIERLRKSESSEKEDKERLHEELLKLRLSFDTYKHHLQSLKATAIALAKLQKELKEEAEKINAEAERNNIDKDQVLKAFKELRKKVSNLEGEKGYYEQALRVQQKALEEADRVQQEALVEADRKEKFLKQQFLERLAEVEKELKIKEKELQELREGERKVAIEVPGATAERVSISGNAKEYPAMEAIRPALDKSGYTFIDLYKEITLKRSLIEKTRSNQITFGGRDGFYNRNKKVGSTKPNISRRYRIRSMQDSNVIKEVVRSGKRISISTMLNQIKTNRSQRLMQFKLRKSGEVETESQEAEAKEKDKTLLSTSTSAFAKKGARGRTVSFAVPDPKSGETIPAPSTSSSSPPIAIPAPPIPPERTSATPERHQVLAVPPSVVTGMHAQIVPLDQPQYYAPATGDPELPPPPPSFSESIMVTTDGAGSSSSVTAPASSSSSLSHASGSVSGPGTSGTEETTDMTSGSGAGEKPKKEVVAV